MKLIKYKFLIKQLVERDIKLKYRRSILGILWSVLNPLFMMAIVSFVFTNLFSRIDNYPMYYMSGYVLWQFFTEATNQSLQTLVQNKKLIGKISVPKGIFPLCKVTSSFINLLFVLVAYIILLVVFRTPFSPTMFLMPLVLIYVYCFALGVSLFLSAMYVYFRDLKHIYSIIITAWMYLTPLFYPASIIPDNLRPIYNLNPLYNFITFNRNIMVEQTLPTVGIQLKSFIWAAGTLLIGWLIFRKLEKRIVIYL